MLCNLHTHTTWCDGESTPEEIVLSALEKGFSSIGFSGHGNTRFDLRYCMKDEEGYKNEIKKLKEKYKKDIEIYLGTEEDMWDLKNREEYDYIIGSAHYTKHNNEYFSVDSGLDYIKRCIEVFDNDLIAMAESYFKNFCGYILTRKPDIVGHFDLITKWDEVEGGGFFVNNKEYTALAEKYFREAIKSECIFEINSGAMSRGVRKTPYPYENLLHILKKENGKIIISSDSHSAGTIDFAFDEMRALLKDIGFKKTCAISSGKFIEIDL